MNEQMDLPLTLWLAGVSVAQWVIYGWAMNLVIRKYPKHWLLVYVTLVIPLMTAGGLLSIRFFEKL